MSRVSSICALAVAAVVLVVFSGAQARGSSSQAGTRPLLTALIEIDFSLPDKQVAFERAHSAGAGLARLYLSWPAIAPTGASRPAGFDARNPGDPLYRWSAFDDIVRAAVAAGVQPIVNPISAPVWTQQRACSGNQTGACRPSPSDLADFVTALAQRYSGSFEGLPRVRYFQIFNEPNLDNYLRPQTEGGKVVSPDWYRDMVNAASRAIHAVHADNVVVAGGLAPFGGNSNDPTGGAVPNAERIHPLDFMRQMLCMSAGANPKPTCNIRSEFDVWAHHPYTYGGPTHSAFHPDDVSMGDLGEMKKLLDAATTAGHITSRQKPAFWVTEFSYDSQPADPKGLPPALHARWVSESLYRMWSAGVSLVTWFYLRDQPFPQDMFQSGLYLRGASGIASDKPKLALTAFRFPFVAFRQKTGAISYWGRTTTGTRKAVVVEQKQGARWRKLVAPKVDRYGIFQGKVTKVPGSGALRARLANGSDRSLAFSLTVPPDFRFCPWGSFC